MPLRPFLDLSHSSDFSIDLYCTEIKIEIWISFYSFIWSDSVLPQQKCFASSSFWVRSRTFWTTLMHIYACLKTTPTGLVVVSPVYLLVFDQQLRLAVSKKYFPVFCWVEKQFFIFAREKIFLIQLGPLFSRDIFYPDTPKARTPCVLWTGFSKTRWRDRDGHMCFQ